MNNNVRSIYDNASRQDPFTGQGRIIGRNRLHVAFAVIKRGIMLALRWTQRGVVLLADFLANQIQASLPIYTRTLIWFTLILVITTFAINAYQQQHAQITSLRGEVDRLQSLILSSNIGITGAQPEIQAHVVQQGGSTGHGDPDEHDRKKTEPRRFNDSDAALLHELQWVHQRIAILDGGGRQRAGNHLSGDGQECNLSLYDIVGKYYCGHEAHFYGEHYHYQQGFYGRYEGIKRLLISGNGRVSYFCGPSLPSLPQSSPISSLEPKISLLSRILVVLSLPRAQLLYETCFSQASLGCKASGAGVNTEACAEFIV